MPMYKVGWSSRYIGTTEVEAESLMDAVESFTPDPENNLTSETVYKVRSVRIIDPEVVTRDNLDSFDSLGSSISMVDCEEIEPSPIDTKDIDGNYSVDKRFENQANKWAIKERKSTPYYP